MAQSLEQTKGGLRFKTSKTKRSRRTIALSPSLVEELHAHRAKQAPPGKEAWPARNHALHNLNATTQALRDIERVARHVRWIHKQAEAALERFDGPDTGT